jgi:hypothetical protein
MMRQIREWWHPRHVKEDTAGRNQRNIQALEAISASFGDLSIAPAAPGEHVRHGAA